MKPFLKFTFAPSSAHMLSVDYPSVLVYPMFVPLARDAFYSRSYRGAVASLHAAQGDASDGIPGWMGLYCNTSVVCTDVAITAV
jgi:hypothetical protein